MGNRRNEYRKTLGRHRIIEKLGSGGLRIGYTAEDTKLHRHIPLNFPPEDISKNAQAVERFRWDFQAGSALDHPHIGFQTG